MVELYRLVAPFLQCLPAEIAHDLTVRALALGLAPRRRTADDPILASRLWGLDFPNPVGLAAGFDKDADVPDAMLGLGFGFVEVGTVTPRPQPGNPKPRLFRLAEDEAVINRMGFNNAGLEAMTARLSRRRGHDGGGRVIGANVGKNSDSADAAADYAAGIRALVGLANYLVVNVSSPNTPGLRALQERGELERLLAAANDARQQRAGGTRPPLLLKIAPDLTTDERRGIAEIAMAGSIDGLIVSNTTTIRPPELQSRFREQTGGLSGRPLFSLATEVLSDMYERTGGTVPMIGVGGISDGRDAYAKVRAGASLVQLYTALVYRGPGLVSRIKSELADHLRRDGFSGLGEAVGADHG